MLGGVVSATVTGKLAVPVSPSSFVAVQSTVVVPIGNVLPDGGLHDAVAVGSLLETSNATEAPLAEVASALTLPGVERTGASASAEGIARAATAIATRTTRARRISAGQRVEE